MNKIVVFRRKKCYTFIKAKTWQILGGIKYEMCKLRF